MWLLRVVHAPKELSFLHRRHRIDRRLPKASARSHQIARRVSRGLDHSRRLSKRLARCGNAFQEPQVAQAILHPTQNQRVPLGRDISATSELASDDQLLLILCLRRQQARRARHRHARRGLSAVLHPWHQQRHVRFHKAAMEIRVRHCQPGKVSKANHSTGEGKPTHCL